jgi:cell division protein FtsN
MSVRSTLAGAGLLALGACLGIVAGSLLDAPRLLLQRLQEPVASVELGETSTPEPGVASAPAVGDLTEYAALQEARKPTRKLPVVRPEPALSAAPKAQPAAKPPAPVAPAPKPEPVTKPEPRAEDVIREIARRVKSPAPPAPQAPASTAPAKSGSVAQVGAFGDTASAQAMVDKLRGLGFDSYISNQKAKGRYSLRVRVRPSNGTNIAATAASLKDRGFDVWVTKE